MNEMVTYETDFHAWAIQNARLLREGKLTKLDAEHIAEELESMSASERRELLNRLQVLLSHLLKYQYQPERRSKSGLDHEPSTYRYRAFAGTVAQLKSAVGC